MSELDTALNQVLDKLCATEPAALSDASSIEALHRGLARLEAVTTRATAAFDAGREWEGDGARSTAGWLAATCRLPQPGARRRVRLGRALRHLPAAEQAWLGGDIGCAQVSALAGARTPATEEAMARDEDMLVTEASHLAFASFTRVLAYWHQHADPDGSEEEAADQRGARRLHLSQSFEGTWFGDFVLDSIAGTIVSRALSRIEDELFEADWAEARARLGEAAGVGDLARTAAQRRADALVEMARRANTAPADGRRPEPLFTVLVGYETLAGRICELANGTVVSPGSLVEWLDQAWVERVVFDAASRVMDVGVAARLFTGATRRAVQVRDRRTTVLSRVLRHLRRAVSDRPCPAVGRRRADGGGQRAAGVRLSQPQPPSTTVAAACRGGGYPEEASLVQRDRCGIRRARQVSDCASLRGALDGDGDLSARRERQRQLGERSLSVAHSVSLPHASTACRQGHRTSSMLSGSWATERSSKMSSRPSSSAARLTEPTTASGSALSAAMASPRRPGASIRWTTSPAWSAARR